MDSQKYKFAAHKDGIIWGIGETEFDAVEEALGFYDPAEGENVTEFLFQTNAITPILAYAVTKFGSSDIKFVHCGETLMLIEGDTVY